MASDRAKVAEASRMTPYAPESAAPYAALMEAFLRQRLSAHEFETAYLRAFKDDDTDWPEPIYQILNEVFFDIDAFYPDLSIQGASVIDEAELRRRVGRSLVVLRQSI